MGLRIELYQMFNPVLTELFNRLKNQLNSHQLQHTTIIPIDGSCDSILIECKKWDQWSRYAITCTIQLAYYQIPPEGVWETIFLDEQTQAVAPQPIWELESRDLTLSSPQVETIIDWLEKHIVSFFENDLVLK